MRKTKKSDCLKTSGFIMLQKNVKNSKDDLSPFYIWTPYTHSTTDRIWQKNLLLIGKQRFWRQKSFLRIVETVWSNSYKKIWLMKSSKENEWLKVSRFAILRSGVEKSKSGCVHYTFERHTQIVQKTEFDKPLDKHRIPMILKSQSFFEKS